MGVDLRCAGVCPEAASLGLYAEVSSAQQAMRVRRAKAERQVDAVAAHGLPSELHIAVLDALALGEAPDSQQWHDTAGTALHCTTRLQSLVIQQLLQWHMMLYS